jgi:hypothetical protein
MNLPRFFNFISGYNFYWYFYAEVYPLRLADP